MYTVPRIIVDDDGYGCHYKVGEILWNDKRECIHITLVNKFGKVMYTWSKDAELKPAEEKIQMVSQKKLNSQILREFCSEKKTEEGVDQDDLLRFYNWYYERVDAYSNTLKPEIIWNSWCSHRKTA